MRLFGIDDDTAYLQHTPSGEAVVVDEVAALVLAQGHEAVDDLATALADVPAELRLVGDCLAPRTVEEAVLEGLQVGAAV